MCVERVSIKFTNTTLDEELIMRNFQRIAEGVNILPLLLSLQRQPGLWDRNRMRKDRRGSPHTQMDDIWVRYNPNPVDPEKANDEHDSQWYEAYYFLPELRPLVFATMAAVEGERLGGVLITRIPPGGRIEPHSDRSWHADYYDKFYLSLKNPPECRFFCEDEAIIPRPGDIYWFDNSKTHWVENQGTDDRITVIMCIRTHRYGARREL